MGKALNLDKTVLVVNMLPTESESEDEFRKRLYTVAANTRENVEGLFHGDTGIKRIYFSSLGKESRKCKNYESEN